MNLLTTQSILDCTTEKQEDKHNKEITQIMDRIYSLPNYQTALRYRFIDKAHQNKEEVIKGCLLHEFMEEIDDVDAKNGFDLIYQSNGILTLVIYGQYYQIDNQWYMVETHVDILPYDEKRNFLNIIPEVASVQTIN